jgi:hypothetical protein
MSKNRKPNRAAVRHTPIEEMPVSEAIAVVEDVCRAGAASPDVQGSPPGRRALADLCTSLAALEETASKAKSTGDALARATAAYEAEMAKLDAARRRYEASVEVVSGGDPAVMRAAGLEPHGTQAVH